MQAVILSIGDELVLGQTVDTNSAWLSAQLARLGIGTVYHHTVADDLEEIRCAFEAATQAAELVLVTGGLGPTDDDLTRQALAKAMGVELVLNEESLAQIQAYFDRRQREMRDRNRVQAMQPAGARMIENTAGTAPGIAARLGRSRVYVMPGVPVEMRVMYERSIAPELDASMAGRASIVTTTINTFGWGESSVADELRTLLTRDRNPRVGTTVSRGLVSLRIRSEFDNGVDAAQHLEETARQIEEQLGPIAFGRDEATLQEALVSLLKDRGLKLVTAESCTGGMLGGMITDVAGASAVYEGGWVTYSNAMKTAELGVSENLLREHGAVSRAVAGAMAQGALERSSADVALAITGIAGPGGGTPEKPAGTVYIALADRSATRVMRFIFPDGRDFVRDSAARCAMAMLRLHLLDADLHNIRWGEEV